MKPNPITLLAGAVLVVIFGCLLFAFQVRQTEVAVVTQFGKFHQSHTTPGLKFRMPWPIQRIYKFENRVQNFEKKFEQTTTKDARNILITVYVGWKVAEPQKFLVSFDGSAEKAEQNLEGLLRDTQNGVIGQHLFSDLITADPKKLKFDEIEQEMLKTIKPKALENYGIEITLLGIKQLGLPESITTKAFERMREERQRLVKALVAEGESQSKDIRAKADLARQEILSKAQAQAIEIEGQADAEAAKSLAVFEQHRELAVFLLQIKALEQSLKDRTTLILDQQTPPFNMIGGSNPSGASSKNK
ncbi:MAG TPA: protease modulator HflC [Roseimicrobium sp.]|nr:protease modulator HflC [Roseimicrobium sp.]